MNKDLFYIYDKLTFKRSELGECQSGFNMGLTIDGTKDSTKVIVWSNSDVEIEPNTILQHAKTGTWWIVKNDKIERLLDENGFVYVHNLQLLGAIELFNARDLTDCGFNQGTYTVVQFITRLVRLSNIELSLNVVAAPTTFKNKVVDYVKTYENYTLLSALRDFLDGYNMCAKLEFLTRVENNNIYLKDFKIVIIPKTGDSSLPSHDISEFDDVRETKTMHQDSFGTTVVSNAENVISNKIKVFPSVGSILPSSEEYLINAENGIIRLPSKVYKGIYLKIVAKESPLEFVINLGNDDATLTPYVKPIDLVGVADAVKQVISRCAQQEETYPDFVANLRLEMSRKYEQIAEMYYKSGTATLWNGNQVNPQDQSIIKGENVPYLVNATFNAKWEDGVHPTKPLIFCDEETKKTLPYVWQGIQWKRGSNIISGFDCFSAEQNAQGSIKCPSDLTNEGLQNELVIYSDGTNSVTLRTRTSYFETAFVNSIGTGYYGYNGTSFIVAYIPMSDIKIKVDNQRTKRDIQLYNQNGKLTDNFALSKMINSYSKEISSDTITRYKQYRNFNDVPKVGCYVTKGTELYVVNNVSMDFTQDESRQATPNEFEYFIDCEITMSKYVSTKSMMVNPNTNIRDYGIPQQFNVKRKQLYRDYYELSYVAYEDREWVYYLNPLKTFNFGSTININDNLTAIMKFTYNEQVNGSYDWYYQLSATTYYMCKMVYYILDFEDNNIIGYGSQNAFSGFVISRVLTGMVDTYNCPISYVDGKGQLKGIDICLCNDEELNTIYQEYEGTIETDTDYYTWKFNGGTFYNVTCFVPTEIYNGAVSHRTIRITENSYNKDATEVPVFEYACQVDDSQDVLIGDNILTQHDNCLYLYSMVTGDNLTQDTAFTNTNVELVDSDTKLRVYNGVNINVKHENIIIDDLVVRYSYLNITFFGSQFVDIERKERTNVSQANVTTGHDIAIFRHFYNTITGEQGKELILIAKNVTSDKLPNAQTLRLQLNHYKLN